MLKDFVGFIETVSGFGNRGNHAANPYFCNLTILSGLEQFQPVSQLLRLRIITLLHSYGMEWSCVLLNVHNIFIFNPGTQCLINLYGIQIPHCSVPN